MALRTAQRSTRATAACGTTARVAWAGTSFRPSGDTVMRRAAHRIGWARRSALLALFTIAGVASAAPATATVATRSEHSPARVAVGYVRGLPAPGPTTSAYLLLENMGSVPIRLVGAQSPRAGAIELHSHFVRDGVARMRRLPHVDIPARSRVAFAPGGLHLMLFRLTSPLADGEPIPIELRFENGATLPIVLPVCSVMRDSCPQIAAPAPRQS